jgi:hypothetical protein
MIDYPDQEQDRLQDPGVPDDIKYLGNSLDVLSHWMKKVYDAQRRQESPNPTLINIGPGITYQSTVRYRMQMLLTSGAQGDRMRLKFGSAGEFDWINVTGEPVSIPLPLVVDAGADVTVADVTNPDTVAWTAYLVGYVELEDRP